MVANANLKWWRSLSSFILWAVIAFPYVPAVSRLVRPWSPWHADALRVSIVTALVAAISGTVSFNLFRRKRVFVGLLIGVTVSFAFLGIFQRNAVPVLSDELFEVVIWNIVAGAICGGAWERFTIWQADLVIKEEDLRWFASALWVPVLRLAQIVLAFGNLRKEALLTAELFCFLPVILWSRPAARILFREARGRVRRLVFISIVCAFLVQEMSALTLFPLAFLSRGSGGTEEAFNLLVGLPGPGILWGIVMGLLLSRSRLLRSD